MSTAKNQHYVPQSYLKRFTSDGTQIHVFNKFTKRSFVTNIKNVACESYFYNISEEQTKHLLTLIEKHSSELSGAGEVQDAIDTVEHLKTVEQRLSQVEEQLIRVIDELIASIKKNSEWFSAPPVIKSLNTTFFEEKVQNLQRMIEAGQVDAIYKPDVALLVALQLVRTRKRRHLMAKLHQRTVKEVSEVVLAMMGIDVSQLEVNFDLTPEAEQLLHLQHMLNADVIAKMTETFIDHLWTFEVNQTSQPLFTSDNPVVLIPHKFAHHRNYTGYASEGIEIRMPLTPQYAVVFYEKTHNSKLEWMEGKVFPLEEKNVIYHNNMQINHSYRQIYCPLDAFELAELICREHPEICNPK